MYEMKYARRICKIALQSHKNNITYTRRFNYSNNVLVTIFSNK